jgi:3-ketosteroid 9alpha-monooxygenase subunit B
VRVVEVVRETAAAHSLMLEDVDGSSLDHRPGQFLTLWISSDRPGGAARRYSLSSSRIAGEKPTVTVKRTTGGFASNWICDHIVEGHEFDVLPPPGGHLRAGPVGP